METDEQILNRDLQHRLTNIIMRPSGFNEKKVHNARSFQYQRYNFKIGFC